MNECINLKNFYSNNNIYKKQDIEQLHNLKRIYSYNDRYDNDESCLLEDLFKYSKLEYVYTFNVRAINNIVGQATLSENVSNLRYLYVYQE